jgi:DNA repair exonuclease SbcCD ATPase subunit
MRNTLFPALAFILAYSLFCSPVSGADTSVQDQPQSFTNQDLGKYNNTSGSGTKDTKTVFQEDREEALNNRKKRAMEEHEQGYWCKKASAFRKKIEKAGVDVKEIEKELSEENGKSLHSGKKNTKLQKRLEKAKKLVKDAEADLDDLEHEAHRKGVPPGWLRCQT